MRGTLLFLLLTGCTAARVIYKQRVAPSRPEDAPDVDYGGVHPFDEHRGLYAQRR